MYIYNINHIMLKQAQHTDSDTYLHIGLQSLMFLDSSLSGIHVTTKIILCYNSHVVTEPGVPQDSLG